MYINAVEVAMVACPMVMPTNAQPLHLGRSTTSTSILDGRLDMVTFYDVPRNALEICFDSGGTFGNDVCTYD